MRIQDLYFSVHTQYSVNTENAPCISNVCTWAFFLFAAKLIVSDNDQPLVLRCRAMNFHYSTNKQNGVCDLRKCTCIGTEGKTVRHCESNISLNLFLFYWKAHWKRKILNRTGGQRLIRFFASPTNGWYFGPKSIFCELYSFRSWNFYLNRLDSLLIALKWGSEEQ